MSVPLLALVPLALLGVPATLAPRDVVQDPDPVPEEAPDEAPVRAWQQDEPYRPPDLEAYFPDDPEGGARLDERIAAGTLRGLDDAAYLACVRRGFRHTTNHRTILLSHVGNRFVWNVEEQDPDAIELCYHAADFTEAAERYGVRHYAVYYGLSVVRDKSPAILRTLADLCVAVDDPNDLSRVAWGAADQLDELLPYLAPHRASEDPWVREKAQAVGQILRGERKAFEWAAEQRKLPPRPRPWVEMPEVRRALSEGTSEQRREVLLRVQREDLGRRMNESYLPDFARAAEDADPEVREAVARAVGSIWITHGRLHRTSPVAVDLVLALSRDPAPDVRHDAVYYGLSGYGGEDLRVLERMVEMALDPAEAASHGRLVWALGRWKEALPEKLEPILTGADTIRARRALDLHWRVFDEAPAVLPPGLPTAGDLVGEWLVLAVGPPGPDSPGVELRVVQEAEGRLVLEAGDDTESARLPLQDWLTTVVDDVLYLDGRLVLEGVDLRLSARLEDDVLSGTLRWEGGDRLVVWRGTRR